MKKFRLHKGVKVKFISPKNLSFKFGYYNFSPFSSDNSKILAHKINFEGRNPKSDEEFEIGYFDLENNERWIPLTTTRAFNWQQGSMLQWCGQNDKRIIFNDFKEGAYVSRLLDIQNKEETNFSKAIYAVDPNGTFALTINFERCFYTRAYSYAPIQDEYWDKRIHPDDCVFKIDLQSGDVKKLFSVQDIVNINTVKDDKSSAHWFEHLMLNPSASRFAFYHRFGGIKMFETSVFTADVDGRNIWQYPQSESERYTHLGWKNNTEFSLFTVPVSKTQQNEIKLRKSGKKASLPIRLYRNYFKRFIPRALVKSVLPRIPNGYYSLVEDRERKKDELYPAPKGLDGHPSFTRCGEYMLSDTYANSEGYRLLYIYNLKTKKTFLLGEFFSPFNNCEWRADLHPRFSLDEKFIMIDSAHNGYHQIVVLEIDWDIVKEGLEDE